MRAVLFLILALAACGRPLTPLETAYVQALQGDETDTSRVRLVDGHPGAAITHQRPARPRLTCSERLWPAPEADMVTVQPAGMAIFNHILLRDDLYRDDFLGTLPEEIDLASAMLFAHEMTHVWQWQNRKRTGYSPLRAASEHSQSDPYLFDEDSPATFLNHGYEQQGAIVEEYVCCALLDPEAPRTERLHAMIAEAMPMSRLDEVLEHRAVRLPWDGVEVTGICR
ncbi:hypothetical protein P775_23965 [Puniceibacterium antarcticum]|uniref:DUF4157 domain-containing protein n=2 Tax=Puniceibacterium antarcticum TaxID=1206336 RepID=A0A2G8R7T7_9RHOB|nr:hypothetical protein [Puniceibacterium antarcticum]PIL17636.1 hypothetical protein P775_23965 [Puniceibacterium antarcticum]